MSEHIDGHDKLCKGATVNTAFDSYTINKQIGNGGNGSVFSASNSDGETVAIKFVKKSIGKEKLRRFKNEIHFCETHSHKNIVEILDRGYASFADEEYAFYVMPLYSQTLKDKISEGIAPADAISIFTGLLEGLKFAHGCATIHRDIKPENILFKADSLDPVICDFGIAHFSQSDLLTEIETRKDDRMCNYQYCASEQKIKGEEAVPQTDIYAAALILNEMFTGEIPFALGFKSISSVNSKYGYLDEVISKILVQTPQDRLYPEDKILSEMKILAEKYKQDEDVKRLQEIQYRNIEEFVFETKITNKEYSHGKIIFTFDCELPGSWFDILAYSHFSYTAVDGYSKNFLQQYDINKLALPIRGNESKDMLQDIVNYMNDWVSTANSLFSQRMRHEAEVQLRQEEARRQAEIAKIENESRLSSIIGNL